MSYIIHIISVFWSQLRWDLQKLSAWATLRFSFIQKVKTYPRLKWEAFGIPTASVRTSVGCCLECCAVYQLSAGFSWTNHLTFLLRFPTLQRGNGDAFVSQRSFSEF